MRDAGTGDAGGSNDWRGCVFGYGKLAAAALVDSVVDPPVTGDH